MDSAPSPVVTLERFPCFGSCPVYRLSIWRDGTVRFFGRENVAQAGSATASIPAAKVDSLLAELEAGGYLNFEERYLRDEPACGLYATDSPTVVTSLNRDGRTKSVRHDYGCSGAPPDLARLERRIDEVAGTARWTGR
jgi:hypothetical protein